MTGAELEPDRRDRRTGRSALAGHAQEPLGGTGGSAGGGALGGAVSPRAARPTARSRKKPPGRRGRELSESSDEEIAREARALGSADGSLADAASGASGDAALAAGPVGGETVGTGAGRGEAGSGLPQDHGELGGGAPLGQHGGSGPVSSDRAT
jgi:DNA polymerase-3 subunit gamma/tau